MADQDSIIINGVEVTARMFAEARQELARKSPFNAGFYPAFADLTEQEQCGSELDAANYLRALVAIAPAPPGRMPVIHHAPEGIPDLCYCDGAGRHIRGDNCLPDPASAPNPSGGDAR